RAATHLAAWTSLMSMPGTCGPAAARTSVIPVPIVPRPTTATVRRGETGVWDRGAAIAGLQDWGRRRETPPGCAEGAHRARGRRAGGVRAWRAGPPGGGAGRAGRSPAR